MYLWKLSLKGFYESLKFLNIEYIQFTLLDRINNFSLKLNLKTSDLTD